MESIPLIRSKIHMPQMPESMIISDRIRNQAGRICDHQLVVITAPAGYGKTTLLAYALSSRQNQDSRICWYRLDRGDGQLAIFNSYLVEMLFPAEEGTGQQIRKYFSDCEDILTRYQYLNALLCQELWSVYNNCPHQHTCIVFDDFHEVMESNEIKATIEFFIDNLPDCYTILIASRCETGILTGKRRLQKSFLELNSGDLCFSEEELDSLIRKRCRINPDAGLLKKIILQTEGWPAGTVLACQRLDKMHDQEALSFLDQPEHKEPLFRYIAQEVLEKLAQELIQLLVKMALLDDFTLVEAAGFLGDEQAKNLLDECEHRGLFIQKTFGDNTTYRFHSLFREALLRISKQYLSSEEISAFHLQAAAYYIEHRVFDRAIKHFIASGNEQAAVELAAGKSAPVIAREAVEELRCWLELLPESLIESSAYLLYFKSKATYQTGMREAHGLLKQALAMFQQNDDVVMQINTWTAIGHLHVLCHDATGCIEVCRQVLSLCEQATDQPMEELRMLADLVKAFWEENLHDWDNQAQRIQVLPLVDDWRWMALTSLGIGFSMLGSLQQALSYVDQALECSIAKKSLALRNDALVFKGIILYLQDEREALPAIIDELVNNGQKHNYHFINGFGCWLAALNSYREHDLEYAIKHLNNCRIQFDRSDNTAMTSISTLLNCLWRCHIDDPSKWLAESARALKTLQVKPSGWFLQEIGLSLAGAVAREAGEFKKAERRLKSAVKRSQDKGIKQILASALLHLAQLYYDTDSREQGRECLQQALELARENRYMAFWDLYYPTLVEMALWSFKDGVCTDYALALIARHFGQQAAEHLQKRAFLARDEGIKDLTASFINRFGCGSDLQPALFTIKLLGMFNIAVNGVAIPAREWKTKKILGIFKYLAVNRGKAVPRDRLMEVFWPDAKKKQASTSLATALYELKKVLKKYGMTARGNDMLFDENRDSLELCLGTHLHVDVDAFMACTDKINRLSFQAAWDEKRALLEEAVRLYQGNFLEGDQLENWTFVEREELKSLYLSAAMNLAQIYLREKETAKAEVLLLRLLALDPYHEEACLNLLNLYLALNQRARAVKLLTGFIRRFQEDLGLQPDKRLQMPIPGED
ncbi:MAG: BTAD domain-containing putative transcriptional regulator [Syntrophomonadaceae bacterium]